ncbi:hypothetical protein SAMN05216188_1353 [Lentzea xinjiangensis]|uniref:Streptogrisin C n=1 Tax=Lentzea xinjiangensis TaxID=402600 RepID=A0A1H9WHZ4_9PSEU|nr:hypothetical protein [Lentzea xinjiangensis]SES33546.1 hypothetical protein SAMN05216188_1353 [Lentzea xinjiangensis]
MKKTRRTTSLTAAVLCAAAVVIAPVGPGAHAESGASAAVDRSRAQRPLVEAAEAIRAEVEKTASPGYAGIVLGEHRVTVWWKGAVPKAVAAVVDRQSRRVPVEVAAAAHSQAELAAAAARIEAWLDANPDSGFHGVKSPGDGSGLVLAAHPTAGVRASASLTALTGQVDVQLSVRHEEPMREVSRQDDSAPWWGGARTWNQTASTLCTSGFGMRDAANRRYLLTAEHCGQVGHRIADGKGEFIGSVSAGHDDHDIGLIPANSENRMYTGGGDSNTGAAVVGWGHVFVGQYLCQSGVTSAAETGGPVCNLKVIFFWQDREDLVEAEQVQGQTAARGGDSGGSVYSSAPGGVVANGTVTRAGGARLGFQDFATASRDFGVTIP